MNIYISLVAVVILLCIIAEKFSGRFGMPALIFFMFLGMLFGSDGIMKIPFDDFKMAENVCSIALLFIMFYGGFNTKWKLAKTIAGKSIVLSTLGVIFTAIITTILCKLLLGYSAIHSFLIGAVLSSTDAASVFSILRKKKLNLKDGTASLLEVESGSNDPVSYMLTIIAVNLINASGSGNIPLQIATQLFFGILIGTGFALFSIKVMTKTTLISEGLDTVFMIAMALACYSITNLCNGNAYLSVYLMGILIGNSNITHKNTLIPFFDGVTGLAQILIFFLLGLLAFPHQMPQIIPEAIAITFFLTIIARPIAVFLLLMPFNLASKYNHKIKPCSISQCCLISWAGLRGASSSVFAIFAISNSTVISHDLFHIVFMVSLFSVSVQGTLLARVASKLDMIDENADVRKTFNDYQEDSTITLMRMYIPKGHHWENKEIKDVTMPTGSLAIMIKREDETIITKGNTKILAGDDVILSVPAYEPAEHEKLEETVIDKNHPWCNHSIANLNLAPNELITMIIRENENLIPDGKTLIHENDIVVMYK